MRYERETRSVETVLAAVYDDGGILWPSGGLSGCRVQGGVYVAAY